MPDHSRHCSMLGESGHELSSHDYGDESVCESQSTELSSRTNVSETEWESGTREPLAVFSVASLALDFIRPFVEAIHLQYCKHDVSLNLSLCVRWKGVILLRVTGCPAGSLECETERMHCLVGGHR